VEPTVIQKFNNLQVKSLKANKNTLKAEKVREKVLKMNNRSSRVIAIIKICSNNIHKIHKSFKIDEHRKLHSKILFHGK
jgi:hypothetical protein